MTISYAIAEKDFLTFQLFATTQSKRIQRNRLVNQLVMILLSLIAAIVFYFKKNYSLAIYFGLLSVIAALFYNKYFKWKYKRHYAKYIKENYSKRFDQLVSIEINDEFMITKDSVGESQIKLSAIEVIDEIQSYFFVKINTGQSIIIPKDAISEPEILKSLFSSLQIPMKFHQNWKW